MAGVAGVTGLEPAASGVTGRRSNQLSYTPKRRVTREGFGNPRSDRCQAIFPGTNQGIPGLAPRYSPRFWIWSSAADFKQQFERKLGTANRKWWAVTGSNRRPPRCKRGALPAELTALGGNLCRAPFKYNRRYGQETPGHMETLNFDQEKQMPVAGPQPAFENLPVWLD